MSCFVVSELKTHRGTSSALNPRAISQALWFAFLIPPHILPSLIPHCSSSYVKQTFTRNQKIVEQGWHMFLIPVFNQKVQTSGYLWVQGHWGLQRELLNREAVTKRNPAIKQNRKRNTETRKDWHHNAANSF